MYAVKSPEKIDAVLRLCRVAAGTVPTARHVPFETPCSTGTPLFPRLKP